MLRVLSVIVPPVLCRLFFRVRFVLSSYFFFLLRIDESPFLPRSDCSLLVFLRFDPNGARPCPPAIRFAFLSGLPSNLEGVQLSSLSLCRSDDPSLVPDLIWWGHGSRVLPPVAIVRCFFTAPSSNILTPKRQFFSLFLASQNRLLYFPMSLDVSPIPSARPPAAPFRDPASFFTSFSRPSSLVFPLFRSDER